MLFAREQCQSMGCIGNYLSSGENFSKILFLGCAIRAKSIVLLLFKLNLEKRQ